MTRRGGRDHERVDAGVDEVVDADGSRGGQGGRDGTGHLRAAVADHDLVDAVEGGEGEGVERADPSRAGQTDEHVTSFVRTY